MTKLTRRALDSSPYFPPQIHSEILDLMGYQPVRQAGIKRYFSKTLRSCYL